MLARAIAKECDRVFFNISSANLMNKYVGESEKMVSSLFNTARKLEPSVIFLDEIDSLCGDRNNPGGSSGSHDAGKRLLTQLLIEIDGISSSGQQILVLGATNRPEVIDEAALRRLPKRIYIRMPDSEARLDLLSKMLKRDKNLKLSQSDLNKISHATEGYSSSDLTELVKDAAMGPIREHSQATLKTIPLEKLRPICLQDFYNSVQRIKPSVKTQSLQHYEEWNKKYGDQSNTNSSEKENKSYVRNSFYRLISMS